MAKSENQYSLSSLIEFLNNNFVLILIVLFFFAGGFVLGSLWTENQLLKSGGTAGAGAAAGAAAAPAGPTGPTEEQLASLPEVSNDDHIRGNKNAKIVLVEYSDFECPYCQKFTPTLDEVLKAYGKDVALVFRHYPLPFHANAQKAAEASECVAKLGGNEKFWEYHDLYFEKTPATGTGIAVADMGKLAGEIGLNATAVQTCIDSGEMAEKVTKQMEAGAAAGVSGTPGTYIVTKDGAKAMIPGALPLDQIKTQIDMYL